ncbi:MAG: DUF2508 family protein [Clostridia bacterium]|nr:DUF2508 family protein [Clostridia bacterium]
MDKLTYSELKQDMEKAREELYIATRSFDYADTNELIDICTLQIAVARKKCDYLIKMAKEQGIVFDDWIEDNISAVL